MEVIQQLDAVSLHSSPDATAEDRTKLEDDIDSSNGEWSECKSALPRQIGLQGLPKELIIHIAGLLNPVDRASLAFTHRWTYSITKNALSLSPTDRHAFLNRLEADGIWLHMILCKSCKIFHRPQLDRFYKKEEGDRLCIQHGSANLRSLSFSPYLPPNVHFDLLAAISRSHKFRPNSPVYRPELLTCVQIHTNGQGELLIRKESGLHFSRGGHAILKSQMILFPGRHKDHDPTKSLADTLNLAETLESTSLLGNICGHAYWPDLCLFMFHGYTPLERNHGQWSSPNNLSLFSESPKALQECIWTHKGDCWLRCKARAQIESGLEGRMWSCGKCSTNYTINTIRLDGHCANFVVMTSWKDLGTCMDRSDWRWRQHLANFDLPDRQPDALDAVAREVEESTRDSEGRSCYFPQLSKQRLREMFLHGRMDPMTAIRGFRNAGERADKFRMYAY
ncbi:hypothetical protein F53441_5399 [Fusarium austroafricanum]|uniref:F-box domain-containing protein n=1 Tax=Fusarium austroafricanum TaxID=2364996 RepID=A0A8H4KI46_9HYPO|nr:hypothetical protein F53441_5399 [Fusarium austroafricanum]